MVDSPWLGIAKIQNAMDHGLSTIDSKLRRARHTPLLHRAAWAGRYFIGYLLYMVGDHRLHVFATLVLYRKFNRLRSRLCAQVIHTGFQAFLPGVEVHRSSLDAFGALINRLSDCDWQI